MNLRRLESFVFEKMAATRLPGLSLALVREDGVIYARRSHETGNYRTFRGTMEASVERQGDFLKLSFPTARALRR